MDINQLTLDDFDYILPEERIAAHPLPIRDDSKLLVYQQGNIQHDRFKNLPEQLPDDTLLIFNDARVIPARIVLYKDSGARVEVFLLSPHTPSEIEQAMQTKESCVWQCMVGNKKRWRVEETLSVVLTGEIKVTVAWRDRDQDLVEFQWNESLHFAQLLELWGKTPLPPYIKRAVEASDKDRYQTVYASNPGAVAAPTAGLHFTGDVLKHMTKRGIAQEFLTLHVGAGTFKPVMVDHIVKHDMHAEPFQISRDLILKIAHHKGKIIPVGTTAMRVLESLYWLGVQAMNGLYDQEAPFVGKLEPYQQKGAWERAVILNALADVIGERLIAQTQIMIMPGYDFKICQGLVTNFHLPKSTLLMLISAFTGGDNWKNIYQAALTNDYRFLSYGDSSLIIP